LSFTLKDHGDVGYCFFRSRYSACFAKTGPSNPFSIESAIFFAILPSAVTKKVAEPMREDFAVGSNRQSAQTMPGKSAP
jgi:hypothetical protein